jgi:IS5 family transposase
VRKSQEEDERGGNILGLKCSVELETIWVDSTCLEANIHHPVDWVLLVDANRTLLKVIEVIRRQGLRSRMAPPKSLMKKGNLLSMEMTQVSRRQGGKKKRKRVLRKLRDLLKKTVRHAQRHRELLDKHWERTELTRKQAEQNIRKIDRMTEQVPELIRQASERILSGRQVASEEKILSNHEPEIRVIKRGKAGKAVEFGNHLFLAESREGMIVDHELYKDYPGDPKVLEERLERIRKLSKKGLKAVCADRQFDSAENREELTGEANLIAPRNVEAFEQAHRNSRFVKAHARRAQTEGRIGILTNNFLPGRPRSKGLEHRRHTVSWAVLTQNLWVLARLPLANAASPPDELLAA